MDLIYQNPFRVLGLPVTATDREIVKCISDLSIFTEMGKTKESDCDYYFPIKPYRTAESIYDASQKIERPNNKLFYTLFWFWENPANTIDEMAFEELKNGNVDKAIQFWEKATNNIITTKNNSNHKNLALLYLGLSSGNGKLDKTMFLKSVSLSGNFLANCNFEDFIKHVIGSKHSIDPLEIINSYVDEIISMAKPYLDKTDGLKTKELIKSFSSYPDGIQNVILDKFVGKHILNIKRQIEIAEDGREENVTSANKVGFELFEKTKDDLNYLGTVLSESDLEYQLIADELAGQIIQCSICYFNEFHDGEIDPGDDALKLAKYAKGIAVGESVNKRIDEGIPILTKYVNEKPKRIKLKPVKEEVDYIYERINNLQTTESLSSYPSIAQKFVIECRTKLNLIKNKLGKKDATYLELCDLVANNAIGMCLASVNAAVEASNTTKRMYMRAMLIKVKPIFGIVSKLDMSRSNRIKYNELRTKLGINQTSSSNNGCYIATMVYGSYNAPEVMVLRIFRDEVLQKLWIGKIFIKIYYRYSPLIAKKTKNMKIMHIVFKSILNPLVNYLKAKYE
ncbi:MAG: hypothetical protein GY845_30110 [Planctomycetes bacterium]|nr:hypothetical protein [Planctomycetota bacterium]